MATTAPGTPYRVTCTTAGGWTLYLSREPGVTWTDDVDSARTYRSEREAWRSGLASQPPDTTLAVEPVFSPR